MPIDAETEVRLKVIEAAALAASDKAERVDREGSRGLGAVQVAIIDIKSDIRDIKRKMERDDELREIRDDKEREEKTSRDRFQITTFIMLAGAIIIPIALFLLASAPPATAALILLGSLA